MKKILAAFIIGFSISGQAWGMNRVIFPTTVELFANMSIPKYVLRAVKISLPENACIIMIRLLKETKKETFIAHHCNNEKIPKPHLQHLLKQSKKNAEKFLEETGNKLLSKIEKQKNCSIKFFQKGSYAWINKHNNPSNMVLVSTENLKQNFPNTIVINEEKTICTAKITTSENATYYTNEKDAEKMNTAEKRWKSCLAYMQEQKNIKNQNQRECWQEYSLDEY